jgi:hypothetical protein
MTKTDSRSSMHVRGAIAAKVEQSKLIAKRASGPGSRRGQSKKLQILKLLRRPKGANIAQLTKATGWQAHSVRAALSRLRKQGHDIVRSRKGRAAAWYHLAQIEA